MKWIAWWPVLIVLVIAVFTDLRSRRIPNWLVLPFMLAGPIVFTVYSGQKGLWQSLEGLAAGGFAMGIFALMGGMGMGDVKLCAALGAWLGPAQLLTALVLTGIVGGIMALFWALFAGFLGELFFGTVDLIRGIGKRGLRSHPVLSLSNPKTRKMPYAPAIAIGTLLSFLSLPH